MSSQLMLAFLLFSTSIAITPGAGNIALLGISSRYGFAATLPFISGNAVGIIIVLAGSSVGLVSLFTLYPELYNILKYVGAAYLLFMAWSIANMQIEESTTDNRSGFMSGVLVQVLNPKGWIASLTVFSQFITPNADYLIQVADRIILAGDSAGGGLAFLLLARLCASGTPPAGVIAFSPWTDLSGSGESYRENVATDVILTPARIRKCSEDARGELASDDPSVSPLFANFDAPPPVLIQHSMAELLSDDSLSMAERLRSFGCDVLVQSWPNTPHVWQFFDGRLPEAREALEDAAQAARRMLKM